MSSFGRLTALLLLAWSCQVRAAALSDTTALTSTTSVSSTDPSRISTAVISTKTSSRIHSASQTSSSSGFHLGSYIAHGLGAESSSASSEASTTSSSTSSRPSSEANSTIPSISTTSTIPSISTTSTTSSLYISSTTASTSKTHAANSTHATTVGAAAQSCQSVQESWSVASVSYASSYSSSVLATPTKTQYTTLCDGHPRAMGDLTAYIFPTPTPDCTIDPVDCTAMHYTYTSQSKSGSLRPPSCSLTSTAVTNCDAYSAATHSYDLLPAGTAQAALLFWPEPGELCGETEIVPTPTGPRTFVTSGITLTSPTIGLSLANVHRNDGCGPTVTATVVPLAPDQVQSINNNFTESAFNFANLNTRCVPDNPQLCYTLVPWPVYGEAPGCFNESCSTIGVSYSPQIQLPDIITGLAAEFEECSLGYAFDPPTALTSATAVATPNLPPAPASTSAPVPSSTFVPPQSQLHLTTATRTAGPQTSSPPAAPQSTDDNDPGTSTLSSEPDNTSPPSQVSSEPDNTWPPSQVSSAPETTGSQPQVSSEPENTPTQPQVPTEPAETSSASPPQPPQPEPTTEYTVTGIAAGGHTATPGGDPIVVDSTTYSALSSGGAVVVAHGTTSTVDPAKTAVTVASNEVLTAVPITEVVASSATGVVVDGQTATVGGDPIVVQGTTYSVLSSGGVVVAASNSATTMDMGTAPVTLGASQVLTPLAAPSSVVLVTIGTVVYTSSAVDMTYIVPTTTTTTSELVPLSGLQSLIPPGATGNGVAVVSMGSQVFTASAAPSGAIVIDGQTIAQGSTVTMDGETVYLSGTQMIVASGTVTETESVQTATPSLLQPADSGGYRIMSDIDGRGAFALLISHIALFWYMIL